jgi:hypothetical protein
MSEGTTKPTGGSMKVEENSTIVQEKIEKAGYNFKLEAMQTEFVNEKINSDAESSSNSSSSEGTKKAGDYTIAGTTATIAFTPLIPAIAEGAKVKLKGDKKKEKTSEKAEEQNSQEL